MEKFVKIPRREMIEQALSTGGLAAQVVRLPKESGKVAYYEVVVGSIDLARVISKLLLLDLVIESTEAIENEQVKITVF